MNAEYTAIAERLQQAAADTVCLVPDNTAADGIKKSFSGCRRLPPIIPLPRLLAAAAKLPADADVIQAARLLEDDAAEAHEQLSWVLYEQLRPYYKKSSDARLQLAQKLARLFLEIDTQLPAVQAPFAAESERSHEWGLAEAMWELLPEVSKMIVGTQPLMQRLAGRLPPLIAVCDDDTTPAQRAFYQQCRADILEISAPPAQIELQKAFTRDGAPPVVDEYNAAAGCGATLTETAHLANDYIRRFLAGTADDKTIGVVVYDRMLARRLRAVAEADGIYIADRGGWRAESLSYGAALSIYAEALLGKFSIRSIGKILCTPFYADNNQLPLAAEQWRNLLARTLFFPASADGLLNFVKPQDKALLTLVTDINHTRQMLPQQPAIFAHWLQLLLTQAQPALAAWADDAVALALQTRLRQRAARNTLIADSDEFLLWLKNMLATEYICDATIHSRVEFSTPGTKRRFDALLLLGLCGKIITQYDGWLGDKERQLLHLPAHAERLEQQRRQFCRLLATHRQIAAVWCASDAAGKPVAANPFWRIFADECRRHNKLQTLSRPPEHRLADGITAPTPAAATLPPLPQTLSLTAADTLMACPYLFYVNTLLKLKDNDTPADDEMSFMLEGELMHRALSAFSKQSKSQTTFAELMECWQQVVSEQLNGNRPFLKLLAAYWLNNSNRFIEWEVQRRGQGWHTEATETTIQQPLLLPSGQTVQLKGRLDRIDTGDGAGIIVIDYKRGNVSSKKKKLNAGEIPQLPLYAFFAKQQYPGVPLCDKMLCRPLHKEMQTAACDTDENRVAARLRRVLRQISAGTPLPAHGASDVCSGCSAIGICRRPHWVQPAA